MYEPKHHIPFNAWLTLWKGCLHFQQYHPLNTSLFGIKTSEFYKSSSGWLWSFIVMIFEWPVISKDSENNSNISGTAWSYTIWLNNNSSQQDFGNVNENVSLQGIHVLEVRYLHHTISLKVSKIVKTDIFWCYSKCALSLVKQMATVSGKLVTHFPTWNTIKEESNHKKIELSILNL